MDILFIGNYRCCGGWAEGARRYLNALLLTNHTIVCRPIYLDPSIDNNVSKQIEEAEGRYFTKSPDVIIQHILPDFLVKYGTYNIGIFYTETKHIQHTGWIDKINLMDEIWVNSYGEKESLIADGVTCKVSVVPAPLDLDKLKMYENVNKLDLPELDGKFVFYFIGEHTDRKNILALVTAFHREFSLDEQVSLLFKTNDERLQNDVNEWRQHSRLKNEYIPEVFIAGRMRETDIYSLHQTGNCFVVTSRGESICLPMLDALYLNKYVITTNKIFSSSPFAQVERDICYDDDDIFRVPSIETPVITKTPPIPHIYTANETWYDISIVHLQAALRYAFECKKPQNTRGKIVDCLSPNKIAQLIEKCLSEI